MYNYFILLAAGSGKRFNSKIPKQYTFYKQKRMLVHSIDKAAKSRLFKKIILVLDYKTNLNGNLEILQDIHNNLIFYNDILEVSKKFPSYLFIIRSKDLSFKTFLNA